MSVSDKRAKHLACPLVLVRPEFKPYQSPMEHGRMITTRQEQDRDLKEHGCRIAEPSERPK